MFAFAELDENIDVVLEDKSYYDAFKEIPFGRSFGHAVLAIQPSVFIFVVYQIYSKINLKRCHQYYCACFSKFLNFDLSDMKDIPERAKITSAELQLSELCALAESIPRWVVVDKVKTRNVHPIAFD